MQFKDRVMLSMTSIMSLLGTKKEKDIIQPGAQKLLIISCPEIVIEDLPHKYLLFIGAY